jgi:hypothetical protein
MKTEIREGVFVSAQYAEKPRPSADKSVIDSVSLSAGNKTKFNTVSNGDPNPFEFVQEVKFGEKYPATDGTIFTKEWADAYAAKANASLLPGSKDGHTALGAWKTRVDNHLYVIAAKVDGESLFIRHYITNEIPEKDYQKLVKEIKSGLISTSVMGLFKYEAITDKSGQRILGWKAIDSVGAERNDLVEWDQAGMNSKIVATSQKADRIDQSSPGEQGVKSMGYKEQVEAHKAAIADAGVSPVKAISDLGLTVEILTDAQKADLADYARIRGKVDGGNVEAFVDTALSSQKASFDTIRDAAIETAFKDRPDIKSIAADCFFIKTGTQKDIDAEIARIKALPSVTQMAAQGADARLHLGSGGQNQSGIPDKITVGKKG